MSTWICSQSRTPGILGLCDTRTHSTVFQCLQHLVLWSDLSKVSLDDKQWELLKAGSINEWNVTCGLMKTIAHHAGHITSGYEVQLEELETGWMKPLRMTHSHLFFFFLFCEPCHWHVYLFLVQGSVAQITGVIAALVMVLTVRWWTLRSVSSGYKDHMGGSTKTTDLFPGWVQGARSIRVTCEPFHLSNVHAQTHIKFKLAEMI